MELEKKTTILFPPQLHSHLSHIAKQEGVSLGQLVRTACEAKYGSTSTEARTRAVSALSRLALPVEDVREMKKQSVPKPESLMP